MCSRCASPAGLHRARLLTIANGVLDMAGALGPQLLTRATQDSPCVPCRAVKYALGKKVSVIVAAGNSLINLDDPKIDNSSPNNGTEEDVIFNRSARAPPCPQPSWLTPASPCMQRCVGRADHQLKPHWTGQVPWNGIG